MHGNKLQGTLIFKMFGGVPHSPVQKGCAPLQDPIPEQGRCYRVAMALRLFYNFLLLLFFNLKTLTTRKNNFLVHHLLLLKKN